MAATTSPPHEPARLYLLYHELRREPSAYSYVMELERFETHLQHIAKCHQQPFSGLLPEVTFDDGHLSDHALALPLLERYRLKGHFFITAGWTGSRAGYMSGRQIADLRNAGHRIGAHGWSHRLLTQCTSAELHEELSRPRKYLEDALGTPVQSLSLPGGRHNRRVLDACREAGYTQVYTSHPRPEPDPTAPVLGRLNLHGDATAEWIAKLLAPESGALAGLMRQDRLKQAGKSLLGDTMYARLWRVLNRAEPAPDNMGPTPESNRP